MPLAFSTRARAFAFQRSARRTTIIVIPYCYTRRTCTAIYRTRRRARHTYTPIGAKFRPHLASGRVERALDKARSTTGALSLLAFTTYAAVVRHGSSCIFSARGRTVDGSDGTFTLPCDGGKGRRLHVLFLGFRNFINRV